MLRRYRTLFHYAFCCGLLLTQSAPAQQRDQALQRANTAATVLQQWYVGQTGLYRTTGWWNAANALTTMIDLMRAGGAPDDRSIVANTFTHAQIEVPAAQQVGPLAGMSGAPGFLNDYYDDEGWWALAWIDAYDLTGEQRYLAMAQSIFADMRGGWDATCGGGIWWSKQRTYKNAIANELFLSVAAHLAVRSRGAERTDYVSWAGREWNWFKSSGMINAEHLVNDGLSIDKQTGTCNNNGRAVWTYNQGVVLGGLAEWSRIDADPGLLMEARILADAGLAHLTDTAGVLHDPCEPSHCGGDASQFKGIFVRNLRSLNRLLHDAHYAAFFQVNAESVWNSDRTTSSELGLVWSGPPVGMNASTQSSALDVLVAAVPER